METFILQVSTSSGLRITMASIRNLFYMLAYQMFIVVSFSSMNVSVCIVDYLVNERKQTY